MSVTIYTTPTCVYCKAAKAYFKENKIEYAEKDVSVDDRAREEMISMSGQMGVPVIDVNGASVIGFDQPRLASLLGIA